VSSNTPTEEDEKEEKKTTQATQLLAQLCAVEGHQVARTADDELWYKASGNPWLRVGSPAFESYALALWISVLKNVPSRNVVADAAEALKALALYPDIDSANPTSSSQALPVYKRAVRHSYIEDAGGTVIYLDRGLPGDTSAYEIRAGKVSINSNPPVVFERPEGTLPLPDLIDKPADQKKAIKAYQALLRLSDTDFVLLLIFLLTAIAPSPKRFLLALGGTAGDGKTSFARMVRAVIDPTIHSEVSKPGKADDFHAGCHHCYVYAVDNVSGVPVWFADALCCLLTGASATVRKFYKQGEVFRSRHSRPVILTSVTDLMWREDLGTRSIPITIRPIADDDRRSDADIDAELQSIMPGLFSALLKGAAHGLAQPRNGLVRHRQQDLVDWAVSASALMGITPDQVADALAVIGTELLDTHLEASPIAEAMTALATHMVETDRDTQRLSTSDLFKSLQGLSERRSNKHWTRNEHWPRTPRALGHRLRDAQRSLSKIGIKVSPKRTRNSKGWHIDVTAYAPTTACSMASTFAGGTSHDGDNELDAVKRDELAEVREKKRLANGNPKPLFKGADNA